MSFVVTNSRIYKEFDSIIEAESFISKTPETNLEIYERDLFGNLRKMSNLEIGQLITKERTLSQNNSQAGQNKQTIDNSVNTQSLNTASQNRGSDIAQTNNNPDGQTITLRVKYEDNKDNKNEKSKEQSPVVKALKIIILLVMLGALVYLAVFIIWPMLSDVITTMNTPPTIPV